jgi:hypothetical protein
MPQTPVFGLPFEEESDQPGITLTGGEFGTEDILAEAVETALLGLQTSIQNNTADIVTLTARVAALEAGTTIPGWTPIQAGSFTGATFDIDLTDGGRFPVGEFEMIRLHMRYDLDAVGTIGCRINGDTGAKYMFGTRQLDAANPSGDLTAFPITQAGLGIDDLAHSPATSSWRIGQGGTVSTNNLMATFFHTTGDNFIGYQAKSTRMSTSGTTHAIADHWGALVAAIGSAPSFLRLFLGSGATSFTNAWWWAEGYRLP